MSAFVRELTLTITKEDAPFAPEEELGEYQLKRWSWRTKQQAIEDSSEIVDVKSGQMKLRIAEWYARMVLACIAKAPSSLQLSLERVENLDPDVGDILRDACRQLTGLIWKEKQAFLQQSDPEKTIPG